ncbi:MAG: TonB-dependent receptor plug domain-containing protein [Gemmatimonadota bacterium]
MSSWSIPTALSGCLAALLLAAPTAAQVTDTTVHDVGTISGRVLDAGNRRPISEVVIRVDGSDVETLSDTNGMFMLAGVPAGEQRLVLEHLSYGEHARRVLVNAGEGLTLEARISTRAIELAPLLVETLSELDRRRITSGAQINEVTRPEIDEAHRTGRSLADVLRERIPGASVRPGRLGGACVEYRGARAGGGACRELTVFVDGVRIADPGLFYTTVPPGDIERMEILSVAEAGARYGSVSGNGVLLIETRRPPQRNRADRETTMNSGFDWTGEARPYAWKRVFATSFAANAIGVGLSLALADQCLWRTEGGSLGLRTRCGGAATTGIGFLSMALPTIGGSFAAQWGGATDLSRGRITPTSLTASLGVASGYMLLIHGTGTSELLGGVILGVGVPVLTTIADRIFRSRH